MRHPASSDGFSLIELIIVIALFAIGAGMAVAMSLGSVPSIRADSQARRVVGLFQHARELAMSSRRNIEVRFDTGANTLMLWRHEAGVPELEHTLVFEYGARFHHFSETGDTPEAYGAESAVDFGDSSTFLFEPDGSLMDETGLPVNGTVFLGIGENSQTARAITLTGTTGRARLYRWIRSTSGGAWSSH